MKITKMHLMIGDMIFSYMYR